MAYLRGFGSYVPERVVGNDELAPLLGVEAEWIVSQSGVRERRWAAADETVASLGHRAAVDCLERAAVAATELGLVIVACGSAERFAPGPASSIAALLGLTATPAIDLPMPSVGSLAGMAMGARLAESFGNVLVVGTEIMSRRIELSPEGRNTAILFGDGAGAVLISPESGFARIVDSCLHTDGSSAEALKIENGRILMDGAVVIRHASRRMPEAMTELLTRNGIAAEDVGVFLLHQANKNLIARIAQTVKAPVERFYANIERFGNTSSASMLIAAAEWHIGADGCAPIMFCAFGVGLTWGAVLAV
ncbi:MAG TPA: ketoacyl-ACP synthase III [Acidobacteriaceae bacterium]